MNHFVKYVTINGMCRSITIFQIPLHCIALHCIVMYCIVLYYILVYTTQVNSAFRALRLVNSEVISKHYSPPSNRREKFLNFRPLVTYKITFWSANYSACEVHTKTIIHLSVGKSDGYLPCRFASQ